MKTWVVIGAATATGGALLWWLASYRRGLRWARAVVHRRFPEVPRIAPRELAAWLEDGGRMPPVVWDVRSAEEYRVSHLPNAVHVEPETQDEALRQRLDAQHGRAIVCYCSAGYRGAEMARRLQAMGAAEVRNLDGGIFLWANESHEVVRDGARVAGVHPYHPLFAWLLKRERRTRSK